MQETQVQSLDCKDLLKKEMEAHSSILGLRNLMDRGSWQVIVHGLAKESDMTYATKQQLSGGN